MTGWLVAIQRVHDDGAIGPLPGEPDVIEIECADLAEVETAVSAHLSRFPDVRDFDLTITNRSIDL